jgi:hypothetical protein
MRDIKTADSDLTRNSSMRESPYDRLGGRDCLERVHRRLYKRLFPARLSARSSHR